MAKFTVPHGLDPDRFLREYWQKAPLRLAGAFPDWRDPLSPEDLAGLACEGPSEARLVFTEHNDAPYAVRYGPFTPEDFAQLPQRGWSLLVRQVDKLHPEVSALLAPFRFLPDWRVDDVMVSYAVDGGSVGPHVDQYDVFLLQGMGRRRWLINSDPEAPSDRRGDTELDVLAHFEPTEEWIQEPGDLLYLPPGIAHHGAALEPCLTYSIGFRAPSRRELLTGWFEYLLENGEPDTRYRDPEQKPTDQPGKLTREALKHIEALLESALAHEPEQKSRWFGRWITGNDEIGPPPALPKPIGLERLQRRLAADKRLVRHPACRMAYLEDGDKAWVFVSGREYHTSLNLASKLGDQTSLNYQDLRALLREPDDAGVLLDLINAGCLMIESE